MWTKDTQKKQKKVYLTFWSKDTKFVSGKKSRTLTVNDTDIEEVYKLVAKFLASQ